MSYLKNLIKSLDKNTFYTISRREAPKDITYNSKNEKELRENLSNIPARHFPAKVTPNDNYSLINCCGDFQIAHKDVWNKIKGFEEEMIYACFVDTNVQKKAVLNNQQSNAKQEAQRILKKYRMKTIWATEIKNQFKL